MAETYPICDDPVAASLRYRNSTEITVLMCEQKPYPMVLVPLIYILYSVNISPHQPPPQALCFSQGREATGDEPQETMGRVQTAGVVSFPPFFIERETSGYEAVTPHKEKFESCFFISLSL